MTANLEQAIAKARELPEEQQNAIAALIFDEISDDARWDAAFARSHTALGRLAAEAAGEDRKGLTRDLEADSL